MNPSCALSNLSSTIGFSRGTRPWDSEISVSAFQALPVHHFTHPIHPFRLIHLRAAVERTIFHIQTRGRTPVFRLIALTLLPLPMDQNLFQQRPGLYHPNPPTTEESNIKR
ncbi:hypothetical protein CQW23_34483 [Capsicum baccatum]|uniref:Uncharacterized protein n=1 Tax=Capsicum baccatum TaxID=33114 RepID=A0A2G2UYW0_CAPBA|nr:hypothetical protein CQW23_34483 [Capsicum baccatum]